MLQHLLRLLFGLIMAAFMPGCVLATSDPPHHSWPKPVAARSIQSFDGVYRNHSLDASNGQATASGTSLFNTLTSRTEDRGTRVEIRSAASNTGQVMQVRLLDDVRRQVAVADLRSGVDYRLARGALILRQGGLGWRGKSTRSGPIFGHASIRLYPSATGGLLGKSSEGEVGLAYGSMPIVLSTNAWNFWPRLAP